jgi:hypothetical protein
MQIPPFTSLASGHVRTTVLEARSEIIQCDIDLLKYYSSTNVTSMRKGGLNLNEIDPFTLMSQSSLGTNTRAEFA